MEAGGSQPVERGAEQSVQPTSQIETVRRLLDVKRRELENLMVVRSHWEGFTRPKSLVQEYGEELKGMEAILEADPAWKEAREELAPHAERLQYYGELQDLLSRGERGEKILADRLELHEGVYQKFQEDEGTLRSRLARLLSGERRAAHQEELSKLRKDVEKYRAMVRDSRDPEMPQKIESYLREVKPLQDRVSQLHAAARTEARKPIEDEAVRRRRQAENDPTKETEESLRAQIKALEEQLIELEGN